MDLIVVLLWFLAFSVIVLFLGALNYYLGRSHSNVLTSKAKSQSDTINQQQTICSSTGNNRRKPSRHAKKKQRQQAASVTNETSNSNNNSEDKQDTKSIILERKIDEEESQIESSIQPTDEEQEENEEFHDVIKIEDVSISSLSTSIQEEQEQEQEPILPVKQRKKHKSNQSNSKSPCPPSSNQTYSSSTSPISSPNQSNFPSKPQASVVPVKQANSSNIQLNQIPQDNNSKSNGNLPSSYNIYSYSGHNSVPPRFRQQQQKETNTAQKFRKRKPPTQITKSSIQPDSAARQNDFVPSKQQINNNHQLESPLQDHESSNQNGYSSESDILSGKTFPTKISIIKFLFLYRSTINSTY
jgi:hypothetical protein